MKKFLIVLSLFLSFSVWGEVTIEKLAGNYEVTVSRLPVTNSIALGEDGNVILVESGPMGVIECKGIASVEENSILVSEVTCANGARFTQRVNLENVSDFEEFTAPLYSYLFGMEVIAHFVRVN